MATKYAILLVIAVIITPTLQDLTDNNIEDDVLEQTKADILKEQTMQNVGGMLNSFMQSEGAKQLGDILSNAATGENAGDILQGLGSVLGQAKGFNPSLLGSIMSMMAGGGTQNSEDSIDFNTILPLLGNLMGGGGGGGGKSGEDANLWSYIPLILQTANSFLGPEADDRARSHSDHAYLLPPIIEKLHVMFDHFINSELGKKIINTIGAEKFIRVFADENGKMSYKRFVEMLENHSFRKHWIRMVTNKIADFITHFADPKMQKKYLTTFQHFLNSILKSQKFPKTTMFDYHKPTETLSALVNHFAKETLSMKIDAKQYVKPFVDYVQDVFRLADKRGMANVDSQQIADKLADTVNLEVIEPLARVNRAFRFARKVPKCDKYVMCLVNQEPDDFKLSLPGLRPLLSTSSSLVFSWFLSTITKTPYLQLYSSITGGQDCKNWYVDACHDFHLEEIKVKRELVHSEL